jgi:hypothetical protein
MADLERDILAYPLPARVLARPRNVLFLLSCAGTALGLLARLPVNRVESLFPPRRSGKGPMVSVERAAIAHSFTDRYLRSKVRLGRRTCLRRSLLLANLLRKSGVEVNVCLGVRVREGRLEGHSWLIREGTPFLEREENWKAYTCVFTLPLEV